jgi:hypothetical protein
MNRRDKDRLIHLSVKVAALREQLRTAEVELDEALSEHTEAHPEPPRSTTSNGSSHTDTMVDRIVGLLEQSPGALEAVEIKELLSLKASIQTVRSTLARLARNGRIRSPQRGQYTSHA